MQELEQAGVLVTGLDKEGHVYYAHKTADMDIACAIKVKSREAWKEWQVSVLSKSQLTCPSHLTNMSHLCRSEALSSFRTDGKRREWTHALFVT